MGINCQMIYHPHNCLNSKKAYSQECRLCQEACPHQAISDAKEIDSRKCTECGVCMAVCPSDGMVDRGMSHLLHYLRETDTVILNCPQARPAGFEIACLGGLDRELWLVLMLLARKKNVQVYIGSCAECKDRDACFAGVGAFQEAASNWPEHPPLSLIVSPVTEDSSGVAAVNVRDATGDWKRRSRDKLENLLPGLAADESYLIPKARQALLEALQEDPAERFLLPALVADDQCTSCGVCVAICPQGALNKIHEDEQFTLIYEPAKCVHCLRCVKTCRPKALEFYQKQLSHKMLTGKIRLFQGSPLHCQRCGKLLFERTEPLLCIACATSDANWAGFGEEKQENG